MSYPISEGTERGALGVEARHFLKHRKETISKQYRAYDWLDWFAVLLPAVAWLRKYNFRRNLLVRHPASLRARHPAAFNLVFPIDTPVLPVLDWTCRAQTLPCHATGWPHQPDRSLAVPRETACASVTVTTCCLWVLWWTDKTLRGWPQVDIVAGLSVGAMVVPQGMSYAKLAGLPQVRGAQPEDGCTLMETCTGCLGALCAGLGAAVLGEH